MSLITDTERLKMLDNGAARARGELRDPPPIVKLFTPDYRAVWLLIELDPADGDTAYGLCDVGLGSPELGTISIAYLEAMKGPKGYPVAKDASFVARQTLSEYFKWAEANGSIND